VDDRNIHDVYDARDEHANNDNRVSYNGGHGGIKVCASSAQDAAGRERHFPAVAAQTEHAQAARSNPEFRANVNHGRPPITATSKHGDFSGSGTASPKQDRAPSISGNDAGARPRVAVHPDNLPPTARPAAPNSGNPRADRKYQQQQDKLAAKQNQERQSLQQKQDSEHQQPAQQKASDARMQQVEQEHQQQTQQLSQRHAAQQRALQSRKPQPKKQKDHPDKKQ